MSASDTKCKLIVTSDTTDFDLSILQHFQEEGYELAYLPYSGDKAAYHQQLRHLADPLELGQKYAIIAYGDAAALCLQTCISPMPKLSAVVAYYPSFLPNVSSAFPPSLEVLIHLAASQSFGTRYPSHRYPNTRDGFAESDVEDYDSTAATLAWSRTIACLRRAFRIHVDLEMLGDNHTRLEFEAKYAGQILEKMVEEPYVNHVPTMTGGKGSKQLHRFYKDFFIPGNPPDMKVTLLSRTNGVDKIVDELLVTFTHSIEIPWILPGIPPTGKEVELVVVGISSFRGGLVHHEHFHWDQATVLVQVGLLDPKLIPPMFTTADSARKAEVTRLPVWGSEVARKVVDKRAEKSNELIPGW